MNIRLFEDDAVDRLSPITTLRPAYAISCGGMRLVDVLRDSASSLGGTVRGQLIETQAHEFTEIDGHPPASCDWLLNARLVPRHDLMQILSAARADEQLPMAWMAGEHLVAAHLGGTVDLPPSFSNGDLKAWIAAHGMPQQPAPADVNLLDYPHDVIRFHQSIFPANLAARIGRGDLAEIADGVFAADGFKQPDIWSVDTSDGPVVLESGCRVGPCTVLQGPVLVGPNAKVNEHAALKENVALGHTTKVGGEVEASIIEPLSNKQHYGFLGHAYVGSWVNLGAGTCNSDLKNTYGNVQMTYEDAKVDSGMQFMGCVLGDYVKTAISSAIFTGKLVGACSMLYGYVTRNVPAFVNFAAALGQVTQVDPEVIVTMQRRMFLRRGREQAPYHVELLHQAFRATADSRQGMEIKPPAF